MFYYVSGTVAHVEPYLAVIDCGGVGYACKTTSTTISQLQVGKASKLYTYLHVGPRRRCPSCHPPRPSSLLWRW